MQVSVLFATKDDFQLIVVSVLARFVPPEKTIDQLYDADRVVEVGENFKQMCGFDSAEVFVEGVAKCDPLRLVMMIDKHVMTLCP